MLPDNTRRNAFMEGFADGMAWVTTGWRFPFVLGVWVGGALTTLIGVLA